MKNLLFRFFHRHAKIRLLKKKKEREEYTFSEKKKETVIKAKFIINLKITYVAYKYLKTCEALKKITFKMLIF